MEKFIVKGGKPLRGLVEIRGSKNVAPKLMIATLLTEEPCFIENVPMSAETDITKELLEKIGSRVSFEGERRIKIETVEIKNAHVPELSRRNRIPILALGPLLHRKGFAEVPVLGGCYLGHRPINFHVEVLTKMGARVERRENSYYAEAKKLHGAEINFAYPSVGATETAILAATLAEGKTVVNNVAIEPEILNLIEMLNAMGAKIEVRENERKFLIEGVENLRGVEIRAMSDRSEIVSFAVAALATDGDVFIKEAKSEYLKSFLEKVKETGGKYEIGNEGMRFYGKRPYKALRIETSPHPGFMTDWQQPFCVLLTQAEGESIIHETVYEDRFGYVKDLNRMRADIRVSDECLGGELCRFSGQSFNHSAVITGVTPLHGSEITMTDIRAGMAHIVASLVAEGESVITGIEHIDRGYEKIEERLQRLGADIKRISN